MTQGQTANSVKQSTSSFGSSMASFWYWISFILAIIFFLFALLFLALKVHFWKKVEEIPYNDLLSTKAVTTEFTHDIFENLFLISSFFFIIFLMIRSMFGRAREKEQIAHKYSTLWLGLFNLVFSTLCIAFFVLLLIRIKGFIKFRNDPPKNRPEFVKYTNSQNLILNNLIYVGIGVFSSLIFLNFSYPSG